MMMYIRYIFVLWIAIHMMGCGSNSNESTEASSQHRELLDATQRPLNKARQLEERLQEEEEARRQRIEEFSK